MIKTTTTWWAVWVGTISAALGLVSIILGVVSAGNTGGHMPAARVGESSANRPLANAERPGIRSLTYAGGARAVVYMGYQDGVLVSQDRGQTWQTINAPGTGAAILAAQEPQGLYLARGVDIYRSENNGAAWQPLSNPVPGTVISALSAPVAEGRIAYAATDQGIFYTPDGGVTWQRLPSSPVLPVTALATRAPHTLFAATTGGMVLWTGNSGQTWSSTGSGLGAVEVTGLALNQPTGDLYASTSRGLFHLANGSGRWQRMPLGNALAAVTIDGFGDPVILAVTGHGEVFRSRDGGLTWGTE